MSATAPAATEKDNAGAASAQRLTDFKYRWPARYRASWVALAGLIIVTIPVAPRALNGASVELITALAGVLIIASLGQTLVIMLGALDLSIGAIVSVSAGMVVHYGTAGSNTALVLLAAVLVPVVLSMINGAMITVLRLNPLIVTLATFGIITGAIRLWTGVSLSLTSQAPARLQSFSQGSVSVISAVFVYGLIIAALIALMLSKTRYGRRIASIGSNRRTALVLGMHVMRTELSTFALAGLLYGLAGVLLAGYLGTPDVQSGSVYQLSTITVAGIAGVLFGGGPASVASVVSAAAFLQMLDQVLAILGLGAGSRVMVQGFVLVVAVSAITLAQFSRSGLSRGLSLRRNRTTGLSS